MNIQEASIATGISKDMIRFYEKKGLLHPSRNPENHYRDYSMGDIHILVTIKFYSSLGITFTEIGKILKNGNIPLAIESFNTQLEYLKEEALYKKQSGCGNLYQETVVGIKKIYKLI